MTVQTLQVLRVLLADPQSEQYGLEIARQSGLATGSIYPILTRLEAAGWIASEWEQLDESREGRRRRRYYRLTTVGSYRAQEAVQGIVSDLAPVAAPRPHGHAGPARARGASA